MLKIGPAATLDFKTVSKTAPPDIAKAIADNEHIPACVTYVCIVN